MREIPAGNTASTAVTHPSRIGVLICHCRGSLSTSTHLEDIRTSTARIGGVAYVDITDDLCQQPKHIAEYVKKHELDFVLLVGCDEPNHLVQFRDQVQRSGLDPLALWAVDLTSVGREESLRATKKAKVAVAAAIERIRLFSGSRVENLKPTFGAAGKEMTRRDLFKFFRLRYEVIPAVEHERCRLHLGCQACIPSCPAGALRIEQGKVSIIAESCTGCGICLPTCPWEALRLPFFNHAEIEAEAKVLLSGDEEASRILTFTCPCTSIRWRELSSSDLSLGDANEVLLPCLGMASPYLMIRAFTLGAMGIALVRPECCRYGFSVDRLDERVRIVRQILAGWQEETERIQIIQLSDVSQLASRMDKLTKLGQKVTALTAIGFEIEPAQYHLIPLLKELARRNPPKQDCSISSPELPQGSLKLDEVLCTMCGLCVQRCPAVALTLGREGDRLELAFHYDRCIGCGNCQEVCPEKCVTVDKTLQLARLLDPKETLCQDEMIKCRSCGCFVSSKRTAKKVLNAVQTKAPGISSTYAVDLCPDCRPKAFLR